MAKITPINAHARKAFRDRGDPRTRKAAETRRRIADAAISTFAEIGYDEATLDDVAAAAQVHKRTLLRHFPTKAHLVLNGHYQALGEFKAAVADRGEASVIDVWEAHVTRWSEKVVAKGPLANTAAIAAGEPAVAQVILDMEAQYQAIIQRTLCQELGRDPRTDVFTHVVAAALVGGNYAASRNFHSYGDHSRHAEALPEAVAIVRRTLMREAKVQTGRAAKRAAG